MVCCYQSLLGYSEMNRRDFSLGGLKGLAVGAMASMGCAGKVASREFKIGDKVLVRFAGSPPPKIPAHVVAIQVTTYADRVDIMYECEAINSDFPGPYYWRSSFSASLLEKRS
jgi:hypothetical protein